MAKKKARAAAAGEPLATVFARGLLVTAFVETAVLPRARAPVLARRAVQGGIALAAGTAAAAAIGRRDWTTALAAVTAGAAGMAAVQLLAAVAAPPDTNTPLEENELGQV